MSQDQTHLLNDQRTTKNITHTKTYKSFTTCDLCKHKRKCNGDNPCLYCRKIFTMYLFKIRWKIKKSKIQSHNNNGDLESVVVAKEIEPELPSLPNTPNSSYSGSGSLEHKATMQQQQ